MILIRFIKGENHYFLPWDNGLKKPIQEQGHFLTLEETKEFLRKNYAKNTASFGRWFQNIESHGTSHDNNRSTPEAILAFARMSPEEAFEKYPPALSEKKPLPPKKEASAKDKKTARRASAEQKTTDSQ